jgi:3-oxoacyl-[acyl-carrier-protein] synthase-1
MTRRVLITGVGLISSIGNEYQSATAALKHGTSGTRSVPEWAAHGLRCHVAGTTVGIEEKLASAQIPAHLRPGMSDGAIYSVLAAKDAVEDAGLGETELRDPRTCCLVGTSAGSVDSVYRAGELYYSGQVRRVDPFLAFRCMSNSPAAAIANLFGIQGRSYSIGSACATGAHNIGHAFELIRAGSMDRAIVGGAEDISPLITAAFQAMRALSTRYNAAPEKACRPYDAARDGVVLSGGAGIVILEELECARRRGARGRAEIIGFGASSDGYDLASPEPEGRQTATCMRMALDDAGLEPSAVSYINTHGTGTIFGDRAEVKALRDTFGKEIPPFSSTKSMTGHAVAAAGAHELIFSVAMLEGSFLAPSINIDRVDAEFLDLPIVREPIDRDVRVILSNNCGFGGTNATLILKRWDTND